MGGLVEEESSETLKKVPFLGDIPLLGRLFSRTATRSRRKSLLIFITTHLVKPTGERYRP
jgi:general secretion pathway protein D